MPQNLPLCWPETLSSLWVGVTERQAAFGSLPLRIQMEATTYMYTGVTEVFIDDAERLYEVDVGGIKSGRWQNEEHAHHAADQCASLAWPAAGVAYSVPRRLEEWLCVPSRDAGLPQVVVPPVWQDVQAAGGCGGREGLAVLHHHQEARQAAATGLQNETRRAFGARRAHAAEANCVCIVRQACLSAALWL